MGHYLGLSVKGIWFRGGKLSAMQGPAPGFVGKRWAGPIIPLIVGILGNMGFPARNSEVLRMSFFNYKINTMHYMTLRRHLAPNLHWGEAYCCQVEWGGALDPGGEAPVVVEVVGLSWD